MTTAPFTDYYLVLGLPTGEDGIRLVDRQIIEAYNAKRSEVESAAATAIERSFRVLMDAEKRQDFNTLILNREMEQKIARHKKRRQLASQKLQEKIAVRQRQPKAASGTKRKNNNIQETETNKRQALTPTVDGIAEAAAVMFATKKCWLKSKTRTRILAEDQEEPQGELFQGWPQFNPPKTQLFQGWPQFSPPKPQKCGELFQGWPRLSPRIA